jgi:hypothetical protein
MQRILSSRKSFNWGLLSAASSIGGAATIAFAQTTTWIAPVDGVFGDPARWSNGVPGRASWARFAGETGEAFTVTVNGEVVSLVTVGNQSVTFSGLGSRVPQLVLYSLWFGGPAQPVVTVESCELVIDAWDWRVDGSWPCTLAVGDDGILRPVWSARLGSSWSPFRLELAPTAKVDAGTLFFVDGVVAWTIDGQQAALLDAEVAVVHGTIEIHFGPNGTPLPGQSVVLATSIGCDIPPIVIAPPPAGSLPGIVVVQDDALVYRQLERAIPLLVETERFSEPGYDGAVRIQGLVDGELIDIPRQVALVSSDPEIVAVVGPDTIRGIAPGVATVTATIGDSVGSVVVTVGDSVGDFVEVAPNVCLFANPCGMSSDGRFAAFTSSNEWLVPGDTNGVGDIFVSDLERGTIVRASVGPNGEQGSTVAGPAVLSDNGRVVAFQTSAPELVQGTNVWLVKDLDSGATEIAGQGLGMGLGELSEVVLSSDGSRLAFRAGGKAFWRDRVADITVPVGIAPNGDMLAESGVEDMTPDGRYVVVRSSGSLFVHDVVAGVSTLEATAGSYVHAAISDDAGILAFAWTAFPSTIMSVRDRRTGVDTVAYTADAPGVETFVSISGDGRFVVGSVGPALCLDGIYDPDLYDGFIRYDRITGSIQGVATRPGELARNEPMTKARSMQSTDGRYCLFGVWKPSSFPLDSCGQNLRRRFGPEFGADIDRDGAVTATDLALLLGAWGSDSADADLDGNGVVESMDVAMLVAAWNG